VKKILKIIFFSVLGLLVVAFIAFFIITILDSNDEDLYKYTGTESTGVADKLGSWGQINQGIKRAGNWKQIVQNSQFQLGEKTYSGTLGDGEEFYTRQYGSYPLIDGSTTCVPMALEFARQHLKLSDVDADSFVQFHTTDDAYINLIEKVVLDNPAHIFSEFSFFYNKIVDLIIATEPSKNELALAKKNNVEIIVKPVCYDAFVFITHKDNPVNNLTVEQVQKIYTGKITNWKEVGGDDMPITLYGRQSNSGTYEVFKEVVVDGDHRIVGVGVVRRGERQGAQRNTHAVHYRRVDRRSRRHRHILLEDAQIGLADPGHAVQQ